MNPRDWVVPIVSEWAHQKRRILFDRPVGHAEGWSSQTLLGKLLEEGAGAAHTTTRIWQYCPDVYTGDALLVQRALERMPYQPRMVMFAHHVIRVGDATSKAEALGLARSAYYSALDLAYHYLAGRIDEMKDSNAG